MSKIKDTAGLMLSNWRRSQDELLERWDKEESLIGVPRPVTMPDGSYRWTFESDSGGPGRGPRIAPLGPRQTGRE